MLFFKNHLAAIPIYEEKNLRGAIRIAPTINPHLVHFRNPRTMCVVMWGGYADPEWVWLKAHSIIIINSMYSLNADVSFRT